MEIVNAIAKARFASVRAQCVQLHKGASLSSELLCMEPGQKLDVTSGRWLYYVVKGRARIDVDGVEGDLAPGQMAALELNEKHRITNIGEQRLICFTAGHNAQAGRADP